jgi:hypothetical protein
MRIRCDYLVLGSGVAGLTCALEAAKHGRVAVITKRSLADSNTNWAQGGIAAVMDPGDSFKAHAEDTLRVGYGLSKRDVVDMVVEGGPDRIRELMALGAEFDTKGSADGEPAAIVDGVALDLTREGGHTARRVVHAGDVTGKEVQRVLMEAARRTPNIEIFEHHMAIDLIELSKLGGPHQVAGAYVLDETKGEIHAVVARATILATGGAGKVYLYTSNPDVATGDGVAMAYRAGARSRTWSSSSSTRRASTTRKPRASSSARPSAARAGSCVSDGSRVHGPSPRDGRPRAPRRGGARHRLRDEAHRRRLRVPRHDARPADFLGALPHDPRFVPEIWDRHHHSAHPGGAGGALHVRRRGGRHAGRAHQGLGPLGHRRGRVHGPARRQPPRLELAARGPGLRPPRRGDALAELERRPPRAEVPEWDGSERGAERRGVVVTRTGTSSAASCGTTSASCARDAPPKRGRAASRSSGGDPRVLLEHLVTRDLLELRNIATWRS